jgi:hypothetical protein
VCVFLCTVFRLIFVLFCVMCVVCVLCLIIVPLPPGENQFAVKINIKKSQLWKDYPVVLRSFLNQEHIIRSVNAAVLLVIMLFPVSNTIFQLEHGIAPSRLLQRPKLLGLNLERIFCWRQ